MANGAFKDNDKLDMQGDWEIIYGYVAGPVETLPSGQFRPHAYSIGVLQKYRLHFDAAGPGDLGGRKYTGVYTDLPQIKLAGETYYDNRGSQQVFFRAHGIDTQAVELHCGAHMRYASDPRGVHVFGTWCNCGFPLGDAPFTWNGTNLGGQFAMVKGKFKDT